jgi:hypothetical protein
MITVAVAALACVAQARADIAPFWRTLAQCETGGRWDWGSRDRPGEGHMFEGGLGFYASTWTMWRRQIGVSYVHAWQAPPAIQVRVAAWGLAHGGYWGCLRNVPRSRYPDWTPPRPWLNVTRFV